MSSSRSTRFLPLLFLLTATPMVMGMIPAGAVPTPATLLREARAAAIRGHTEEALSAFGRYRAKVPGDREALVEMAEVYRQARGFRQALALYLKALEISGFHETAAAGITTICLQAPSPDMAMRAALGLTRDQRPTTLAEEIMLAQVGLVANPSDGSIIEHLLSRAPGTPGRGQVDAYEAVAAMTDRWFPSVHRLRAGARCRLALARLRAGLPHEEVLAQLRGPWLAQAPRELVTQYLAEAPYVSGPEALEATRLLSHVVQEGGEALEELLSRLSSRARGEPTAADLMEGLPALQPREQQEATAGLLLIESLLSERDDAGEDGDPLPGRLLNLALQESSLTALSRAIGFLSRLGMGEQAETFCHTLGEGALGTLSGVKSGESDPHRLDRVDGLRDVLLAPLDLARGALDTAMERLVHAARVVPGAPGLGELLRRLIFVQEARSDAVDILSKLSEDAGPDLLAATASTLEQAGRWREAFLCWKSHAEAAGDRDAAARAAKILLEHPFPERQESLSLTGDTPERRALTFLGPTLSPSGVRTSALEVLERATLEEGSQAPLAVLLAQVPALPEDPNEAARASRALLSMARATGLTEPVQTRLTRWARSPSAPVEVRLAEAEAWLDLGRSDRARVLFGQLKQLVRGDSNLELRLLKGLLSSGASSEVTSTVSLYLPLVPTARHAGRLHLFAAMALGRQGHPLEALTEALTGLGLDPSSRALADYADRLLRRLPGRGPLLNALQLKVTGSAGHYPFLAHQMIRSGSRGFGEGLMDAALRARPGDRDLALDHARYLISRQSYKRAERVLERYLRSLSSALPDPPVIALLARVLSRRGGIDEIHRRFESWLARRDALQQGFLDTYLDLALEKGWTARGRLVLARLQEEHPGRIAYAVGLASLARAEDDLDGERRALESVRRQALEGPLDLAGLPLRHETEGITDQATTADEADRATE